MSQTATITQEAHASPSDGIELTRFPSTASHGRSIGSQAKDSVRTPAEAEIGPSDGDGEPPADAQSQVERWNYPRSNVFKLGFAFLSFVIAGMNDGAVGALIPYLEKYYDLNYTVISLIFLTPFAGYSLAAFTNARIHVAFGRRGVAIMAPLCHIITYAVLASHPPYPALVVANAISGFGNGLTDACFCAWVGAMDKANAIQGFLHSCYSLGALFAPLIATSMVVTAGLPWYNYYYVMIGISFLELVGLTAAFWDKPGSVYRAEHTNDSESSGAGTREAIKSKVTWLCAAFFFTYMGVEVGLGGWVVTFMLKVRHATPYASGISGSGFWAGMTLGRAALGFVTERYGERICLTIYLAICLGLELLFWLVPQFVVSAVAVAFLGFFLGPMFPGAVMVTAKLLPKRIHVSAIGFAMALGGTGGTVFPFIIGAVASSAGVKVLQPIVLALIVVVTVVWLSFPRIRKRE
ncbi:major facilitator superfamily transporter [Pochonia chlamydosporia 170]|uniref:Major facilitator superfamily transporter n=1 Tax=Pochonia chlamydosporia 170 TaxID=1380566 RepID=A0A179FPY7_METCM|nr:major facilitator superfamily transporter [Pochonia chlamydosporia 170]OAQ67685.1 major facilitator superfamily transporter [Pochonia chlamydosporia 170]